MKHLLSILTFFLLLTACDIADKESLDYFSCYESGTTIPELKLTIDKNASKDFPLGKVIIDEGYTLKIISLEDYRLSAVLNNGKDGATTQNLSLHRYTGAGLYTFYSWSGEDYYRQTPIDCKKLEKLF